MIATSFTLGASRPLPLGRSSPPASEPAVRIRNVSKRFGRGADGVAALGGVSFDVQPGEFFCLLGASGSGKSTLLNIMAGLEQPTGGTVELGAGSPALMFQDAGLFPWLTVEENIAFPLRMQRLGRGERRDAVAGLIELVHLHGFAHLRPHELSGGMRQRVALARALAQKANVLLMDEPFRALDVRMRGILQHELERIWRERGLTIIFVTHDVDEAVRLADRIVLLSGRPGRVAAEYPVGLGRPRAAFDANVRSLAADVTAALWHEADDAAG